MPCLKNRFLNFNIDFKFHNGLANFGMKFGIFWQKFCKMIVRQKHKQFRMFLKSIVHYSSHLTVTGLLRFAVDVTAICCAPPFSGTVTWDRANPIPATTKYFNNINEC